MKEIKLLTLDIRNFKGCAAFSLSLDGRSASIYGDNAAGKTTIYDALTWLLFGKDSRGRGDFEIKPLDSSGQIKDHAAVTEVEATFLADGMAITLRKTFYERWSTKRGSIDATYDGNTSEYYVDGIPSKKYEYERRVSELVDETLFRTLTNVTYFCESMDWRDRRKTLLDVCGVPDDHTIMAGNPDFAALALAMGHHSLDDLKKKLIAQRKGLNGTRNTIPARLDEQRKTIEQLRAIDFVAIQTERDAKAAALEKLSGDLAALSHGTLLDNKRNEAGALRNELQKLVNENNNHRASQMVVVVDERPAISADLESAKSNLQRCQNYVANEDDLISNTDKTIEECRTRWTRIDAEVFESVSCPTCGQQLPADAQEKTRRQFEEDKERRKADAVAAANSAKQTRAAAVERRDRYAKEVEWWLVEAARFDNQLASYVPDTPPVISDLPGFEAQSKALTEKIYALEREAKSLEQESADHRRDIEGKIATLRADITALDGELAKKTLLSFAQQREEELRQEAQKAAVALEELDRQLYLCDEFTRFKVSYIESSINSKFELARFRLFQEQVNGGLADCCDATYDGVPYSSLNNGMRINIGVDVIRTISKHYGLRVPLVVDNAESVVSLLDADTQVIRLVVSGADKELRCEYEN